MVEIAVPKGDVRIQSLEICNHVTAACFWSSAFSAKELELRHFSNDDKSGAQRNKTTDLLQSSMQSDHVVRDAGPRLPAPLARASMIRREKWMLP